MVVVDHCKNGLHWIIEEEVLDYPHLFGRLELPLPCSYSKLATLDLIRGTERRNTYDRKKSFPARFYRTIRRKRSRHILDSIQIDRTNILAHLLRRSLFALCEGRRWSLVSSKGWFSYSLDLRTFDRSNGTFFGSRVKKKLRTICLLFKAIAYS